MKRRFQAAPSTGPFISYSRKDQDLVRRLHDALAQRGRAPWVDWQGILPTEEWMRKIRDAIDAGTAFVFILSPDSVASRVCADEVDHAVTQRKRLIPVLYREVDAAAVHPDLARLNWVRLRADETFEAGIDALVEAMDLDLDWIRHHTRLLVRAGEWLQRGRETSLLLRGRDLKEAETWLAQTGTSVTRVASDAQMAYIAASRQDAGRRQRWGIGALTAGLLVAVTLGLLAWQQRNEARAQRDIANSRLLASQSAAQRERHLDLALLLSVEALRIAPTAQARVSLLNAAQMRPRLRRYLKGHGARIDRLIFARSGPVLASSDQAFDTRLWDSDTGRLLLTIRGEAQDTAAVALSGDGRWLARGRVDGSVVLRNVIDGAVSTLKSATGHGAVAALGLSDDGSQVVVGTDKGSVALIASPQDKVQCRFAPSPADKVSALWVSSDQRVVSRHAWRSYLWSSRDCAATVRELPDPHTGAVALDWRSGTLIGTEPGPPNLKVIDLASARAVEQEPAYKDYALALAFLGRTVAIGSRDGTVVFWDMSRRSPTGAPLVGHASAIFSLAVDERGERLASGALDGDILLWDVSGPAPHSASGPLLRQAGDTLWTLDDDGRLTASGTPASADLGRPAVDLALSADGQRAATVSDRGEIEVFAPATPAHRQTLDAPRASPVGLALHPTVPIVALISGGDVIVWHTERNVQVARLTGHGAEPTGLAFSPDGTWLASAAMDNRIRLWRTARWELHAEIKDASERYVRALAFDAQSRWLAAGGGMEDGTVTVWELATRRRLFVPLRSDEVDVSQVAFNASGTLLAGASFTGGMTVWDLATQQRVAQLPSLPTRLESGAVFAFGAQDLVVATAQGLLRWPLVDSEWERRACALANRNLTSEEWARHLPDYPYRSTCPIP